MSPLNIVKKLSIKKKVLFFIYLCEKVNFDLTVKP